MPDSAHQSKSDKRFLQWACRHFFNLDPKIFGFDMVSSDARVPFENGLLLLEKNFVPTKHKIGVLNVLPGHTSEADIYLSGASC